MAQVTGTTDSYDLVGIAEDVEDVIYNITPTETPFFTMCKKGKAENTLHQWQTDALAAAATNRQIEGDDAAFVTAAPTTMLSNYTQISRKTVLVSETADAVRKYGRDTELARLTVKFGKELKRDIEIALNGNQASSAGGSSTARSSAGIESMIAGNRVLPTTSNTGTTPGYAAGVWAAPTDGTATGAGSTLTEDYLKSALEASWLDGGDPSVVMVNTYQKKTIAGFSGASKFAGNYIEGGRTQQGVLVAGVDMYISDFGEHKIMLNRHQRQRTLLALDPEYLECSWLRPIQLKDLAKTGDAEKKMLRGEFCLVVGNPDAHAKISDLFSV
jgi:Mu-like prophage tail sheath protein gpL